MHLNADMFIKRYSNVSEGPKAVARRLKQKIQVSIIGTQDQHM